MKRSIIVALASATITLGTVASASAAPVEDPGLPAPWAGSSSGSSDFFYPHDGQNSGSTDLANSVALAPFDLLCRLLTGEPLLACIPNDL
ncbi:hypothetical protein [Rhodococcus maanshanensis]|uniref:Uncharacterized protein n=1 Tax=Rhodococcus maanshanensis TaxID=183556 RepID=A0A1H7V185_9NOCA|nr:hypothetical protein [Rhodococcus maanshanensis]SEM02903.1 hypothetical protein SAMN05444583_12038 [Rhodococcus maanshanensis]